MTLEVIATLGLPASGKSTWARRFVAEHPAWAVVNNDVLRVAHGGSRGIDPATEPAVRAARVMLIRGHLSGGRPVVVDNCNLSVAGRVEVMTLAAEFGARLWWVPFLDVPVAVCIQRDRARPEPAGATLINKMWRNFRQGGWLPPKDMVLPREGVA